MPKTSAKKNYKKLHSKSKTNRIKEQSNHMIISIKAEKIINKFQLLFMVKNLF